MPPLEFISLSIGLALLILGAFIDTGLLVILLSLSVFPLLTSALACYSKGIKGLVYLLVTPLLYMLVSLITFLVAGFSLLETFGQIGHVLRMVFALFAPLVVGIIVLATSIIGSIIGFVAKLTTTSRPQGFQRERERSIDLAPPESTK